jgi:predicted Zn finger-like uncharacterized protein
MLIACPSCATSYNLDAASLEPNGRQVRCVRCRTIWQAEPDRAEAGAITPGAQAQPRAAAADGSAPRLVPGLGATDEVEWQETPTVAAADSSASNQPATTAGAVPALRDAGTAAAAEPATIEVESPPLAPVDAGASRAPVEIEGSRAAPSPPPAHEDIETYAARRAREERFKLLRWPLSLMQSIALLLLIIDAILIGWRDDMVRLLPQTASFYTELGLAVNVRGLSFTDISTTTEMHDGVPILVVEGSIVNDTRKILDVPRLKFAVRNAGNEELYSWTAVPPRSTLPPGASVPFHSRLASPPPDGRDVLVRFVTRHDLVAGGR